MARDYKDPAIVATASFDPAEPGGLKTAVQDGSAVTLVNGTCPGHHNAIVQRVTNSNGGDVAPCLPSTDLVKQMTTEADKGGGYVIATFENHATDSRVRETSAAPCVGASHNASADNNNPLVVTRPAVCYDGYNTKALIEHTVTLRTDTDMCVVTQSNVLNPGDVQSKRIAHKKGVADCLSAYENERGLLTSNTADDLPRVIVRRLTPVECERLMGLPDGWTRVTFTPEQIADDALVEDFRRIHDAFAQMVAKPGTTPKPKTAKFVRDWLTRISDPATCPDAPRYKACGNGWAANQPRWILFNLLALDNPDWQEEWFAPQKIKTILK